MLFLNTKIMPWNEWNFLLTQKHNMTMKSMSAYGRKQSRTNTVLIVPILTKKSFLNPKISLSRTEPDASEAM